MVLGNPSMNVFAWAPLLAASLATGPAAAAELAFRAPQGVAALAANTYTRLLTARLDADPFPDTLVWPDNGALPHLTLRRGGAGGLAASVETIALGSNAGPSFGAAALGDIDGDGDLDLAVIRPRPTDGQQELYTLLNDGNAGFSGGIAVGLAVEGANQLVFADLDGDGAPELLADRPGTNQIRMWRNQGGTYAPAVALTATATVDDLAVADMDGDGNADLVLGHNRCCNGGVPAGVMRGRGDGTFRAENTLPSIPVTNFAIEVADLDDDGDPDLIVNWVPSAIAGDHDVGIYRNDGGTLVPVAGTGALTGNKADPKVGDFDGDGITDLVASVGHGAVAVRRGLGGLVFADPIRFESGIASEYSYFHAVADVDADGRDDLVVGGVGGDATLILSTTASGNTAPQVHDLVFEVGPEEQFSFFPAIADAEGHYVDLENPIELGTVHGALWLPATQFVYLAPPLPLTAFTPIPGGVRVDVLRKVDDVFLFEAFDDRGGRAQFRVTFKVRGRSAGGGGGGSDLALLGLLCVAAFVAREGRR